ncbi:MAG: putative glycosyltransferase [Acidimicrobiaceae bacterium]|nr:putative glycosyltransferase [Acidimicrobiaceae bacterium]
MTVPRTTRRPVRREFDTEATDVAHLLATQSDLLVALRKELAQVRTELAQLRRSLERARVEGEPASAKLALAPPVVEPPDSPHATLELAQPVAPEGLTLVESPMDSAAYARLITRIRSLARTVVPFNAVVAVVSRGDEALVDLDGRIAWHFPRLDDGRWLGHHPLDSREAIAHLERIRRQGARYLLFPSTALWWLTHYEEFTRHLESTSTPLARHDDACRIFALQPQEAR